MFQVTCPQNNMLPSHNTVLQTADLFCCKKNEMVTFILQLSLQGGSCSVRLKM